MMSTTSGVLPRPYDAYADAIQQDIHVGIVPLTSIDSAWVPSERAIVVSSHLSETRRHAELAHQLRHAELAGSRAERRRTISPAQHIEFEQAVRATTAERLIPIEALAAVLIATHDAIDAAARLQVDRITFGERLRGLSKKEARYLGDLADRVEWPSWTESARDVHRCGAETGTKVSTMKRRAKLVHTLHHTALAAANIFII